MTIHESTQKCPCCNESLTMQVTGEIRSFRLSRAEEFISTPDKPPAVGDWVFIGRFTEPQKILCIEPKRGWEDDQVWIKDGWYYPKRIRKVVRRKDDLLQKGDRGLLDEKIEVWFAKYASTRPFIWVSFQPSDVGKYGHLNIESGYIDRDRFELTEPVFDRKED